MQQVVLARLIEQAERFKPFDAAALTAYAREVGEPVSTSDVQSSLDALRDKGLIVRLDRGAYTLDDASMPDWYASRRELGEEGDGAGGGMSGGPS